MKNFLAIFLGSEQSANSTKWNALDEKARQTRHEQGIKAWQNWVAQHQKDIVGMGAPLGKTKAVDPKGMRDAKNMMTAYTVVRAESHEEAAKMFLDHPHFMIFPGDSIEIMECLPIPGMP